MRELNIMEIETVSGAGFFSRIAAAGVGALGGVLAGMMKGGTAGGSTGGILGVGVVGALGGLILGGITLGLQGAVYGLTKDWDDTVNMVNAATEEWIGQGNVFPKV